MAVDTALGGAMKRRDFIKAVGGSLAAWPVATHAQQPMRRVGVLMSTAQSDPREVASIDAFLAELEKRGWSRGKNLEVIVRWGETDSKRMTANAAELVGLNVDVLLAKGAHVPSARQATTTIPIVFVVLIDSAAEAIVGAFSRPIGNLTGFTTYEHELVGKRLGVLRDLSPRINRVLYLRSRQSGVATQSLLDRLVSEARTLGLPVVDGPGQSEGDVERAVQDFAREPDGGVMVAFDAFTLIYRQQIVALAQRHRLPAIYPSRAFSKSGGLCCYGFDQDDQFRQAAGYVARLLEGAKPSDLPVQAPTKFDLSINRTTAKNLGLTIPPMLLATADEIED
jgi:putative tryptophan/tyrosine transport system substrate-binding protein